jgi:hypothetical protein
VDEVPGYLALRSEEPLDDRDSSIVFLLAPDHGGAGELLSRLGVL